MSALQRNVLLLELSTLQGPELHLKVSALQRSVLLLEVTATGPELHLDVSALQRNLLLPEVSTLQGPELYLDVSATEECAAPGGVYTNNNNNFLIIEHVRLASKIIVFLANVFASLRYQFSFYLMCSLRFVNNFLTNGRVRFRFENSCLAIERVRFASKIFFVLSNAFASFRK